jgi:hypothetical protein
LFLFETPTKKCVADCGLGRMNLECRGSVAMTVSKKRHRRAVKEAGMYLRLFLAERYGKDYGLMSVAASPAHRNAMYTDEMFGIRSKDRITVVCMLNTRQATPFLCLF